MTPAASRRAAVVSLGCARNDVDSEELAARLDAGGWTLVADPASADAVVVNTCGFIDAAKKDSVDTLLAAADLKSGGRTKAVVAVGCLAERYGEQLAASLPEADAVLGFDAYPELAAHLDALLAGRPVASHTPRDRRRLLPIAPVERRSGPLPPGHGAAASDGAGLEDAGAGPVGPASGPRVLRRRLHGGPVASLKLASGCDRRCSFCAIPAFRGSFVSRSPDDVLAEAEWLAADGVRELVLVSENSTSYGKDLGDVRALEALLPQLAAVRGIVRVRVAYLQPAEVRPGLLDVLLSTPGVAPYLDLSFQHASGPLLRRMRRFGDGERFLALLAAARERDPRLGARSNVIVGFPGETRADVAELERFLGSARLDAVGVFGYSDEDGTEAAGLPGKVGSATRERRARRLTDLVEVVTAGRAEERVGEVVDVLVEQVDASGRLAEGRAAHQAPEVDGSCTVRLTSPPRSSRAVAAATDHRAGAPDATVAVGDLVRARVVSARGVDLVTELVTEVDGVAAAAAAVPALAAAR